MRAPRNSSARKRRHRRARQLRLKLVASVMRSRNSLRVSVLYKRHHQQSAKKEERPGDVGITKKRGRTKLEQALGNALAAERMRSDVQGKESGRRARSKRDALRVDSQKEKM